MNSAGGITVYEKAMHGSVALCFALLDPGAGGKPGPSLQGGDPASSPFVQAYARGLSTLASCPPQLAGWWYDPKI